MEPCVHPIRTIKPVIQKDLIYGNQTPTQIEQQIRTEQDFVRKVLRQGYQEQPDPIPLQSPDPRSENRDIPILGNSSEEESNRMAEKVELSSSFISELLAHTIESSDVPKFFHDIKKMPKEDQKDWEKACDNEMKSLADRKVWKLVDLPAGRKTVKCRWVFAAKSDGRKKAHLVAKGFTQVYGIDFEETFSLVARFETVRILLALAALEDRDIKSLNVKTAYLYGELDEEIYMDQPEGYIKKGQERKVCRLLKSLYGLKQSALQWNKELHKSLLDLGFTRT